MGSPAVSSAWTVRPMAGEGRPGAPYFPPPKGTQWQAVPTGPEWSTDPARVSGLRCRWQAQGHRQCQHPAVAALNRGRHSQRHGRVPSWWGYCGDHLYGGWIEDGRVTQWRLVEISPRGSG
jgi:hypothetical protein